MTYDTHQLWRIVRAAGEAHVHDADGYLTTLDDDTAREAVRQHNKRVRADAEGTITILRDATEGRR